MWQGSAALFAIALISLIAFIISPAPDGEVWKGLTIVLFLLSPAPIGIYYLVGKSNTTPRYEPPPDKERSHRGYSSAQERLRRKMAEELYLDYERIW